MWHRLPPRPDCVTSSLEIDRGKFLHVRNDAPLGECSCNGAVHMGEKQSTTCRVRVATQPVSSCAWPKEAAWPSGSRQLMYRSMLTFDDRGPLYQVRGNEFVSSASQSQSPFRNGERGSVDKHARPSSSAYAHPRLGKVVGSDSKLGADWVTTTSPVIRHMSCRSYPAVPSEPFA
jgi:hypothetical protein